MTKKSSITPKVFEQLTPPIALPEIHEMQFKLIDNSQYLPDMAPETVWFLDLKFVLQY